MWHQRFEESTELSDAMEIFMTLSPTSDVHFDVTHF